MSVAAVLEKGTYIPDSFSDSGSLCRDAVTVPSPSVDTNVGVAFTSVPMAMQVKDVCVPAEDDVKGTEINSDLLPSWQSGSVTTLWSAPDQISYPITMRARSPAATITSSCTRKNLALNSDIIKFLVFFSSSSSACLFLPSQSRSPAVGQTK